MFYRVANFVCLFKSAVYLRQFSLCLCFIGHTFGPKFVSLIHTYTQAGTQDRKERKRTEKTKHNRQYLNYESAFDYTYFDGNYRSTSFL